jgi:hypothetical protein
VADSVESLIQPLNNSVVFAKKSDILLTNYTWRIAIDLDTSRYHEVISAIRDDLLLVESQKQELTPTSELRHFDTFYYS